MIVKRLFILVFCIALAILIAWISILCQPDHRKQMNPTVYSSPFRG